MAAKTRASDLALVELDLDYGKLAKECGVPDYIRVPTVSVRAAFIEGLAKAGDVQKAGDTAYYAMVHAAKALIKISFPGISDDEEQIISEFRARYYDTEKFFDPFAGGKFANHLFDAHAKRRANPAAKTDPGRASDETRYLIDEAQLFIDASHSCYNRLGTTVSV